jgi:glycosyltransferase involved in cell wall biosynthesis
MTQALPLVSVVIPSYNHGHLIGRALSSVLAQSWPRLEVIVVDNHSTDNTDEVVNGFTDARVRLLKVYNGGTIAISRNLGISDARGEWIAFLDSDDWWTHDKLVRCAQHFDEADFIYHRLRIVTTGCRPSLSRHIGTWQVGRPVLQHMLIDGNPVATSSVVVRRALLEEIGGFDERREIVAAEDYDAWLRIAKLTERFRFVHASLGYYLFSMQSASRKDMSLPMREVYAAHANHLAMKDRERMEANAAYAAGRHAWRQGDQARARTELYKALRWGSADLRLKSMLTLLMLRFRRIGVTAKGRSGGRG